MNYEDTPSIKATEKQPLSKVLMTLLIIGPIVGFILGWKVAVKPQIVQQALEKKYITPPPIPAKTIFNENEVSYGEVDGSIVLHYNGKFFRENPSSSTSLNQEETEKINPEGIEWKKVVSSQETLYPYFNELFDFKMLPSKDGFIVVMRWPQSKEKEENVPFFYVYEYKFATSQPRLIKLFTTPSEVGIVPVINSISLDEKFISFYMFSCWNCGGHHPSTTLVRMSDGESKNIGLTAFFQWKENGAYEYKKSVEIPCPEPEGCYASRYEEPGKLPLVQGVF